VWQGILSDGVSRNLAGLAIFVFLMTFTLMFVVCAVALDVKGSARQVPHSLKWPNILSLHE